MTRADLEALADVENALADWYFAQVPERTHVAGSLSFKILEEGAAIRRRAAALRALARGKPMDDDALKMARECYVEYMHKCAEKAGDTVVQASVDRLLSGQDDHMHGVQIALAMHARMQAEITALKTRPKSQTAGRKMQTASHVVTIP